MKSCGLSLFGTWAMAGVLERVGFCSGLTSLYLWFFSVIHYPLTTFYITPLPQLHIQTFFTCSPGMFSSTLFEYWQQSDLIAERVPVFECHCGPSRVGPFVVGKEIVRWIPKQVTLMRGCLFIGIIREISFAWDGMSDLWVTVKSGWQ